MSAMRVVFLCLVVAATAQEEELRASLLPLLSQLQSRNENRQSQHRQAYETHGRRLTALSPSNTAPIRLHLDFQSLYEAHAPQYSACFTVGAWFRRGLPSSHTPPANGVETCVRGPGETLTPEGCWGKCLATDLIDTAGRAMVIEVVQRIASELGTYFSVVPIPASSPLKFDVSNGNYANALYVEIALEFVSRRG